MTVGEEAKTIRYLVPSSNEWTSLSSSSEEDKDEIAWAGMPKTSFRKNSDSPRFLF
jgi:hypothetical protein